MLFIFSLVTRLVIGEFLYIFHLIFLTLAVFPFEAEKYGFDLHGWRKVTEGLEEKKIGHIASLSLLPLL
jgi:hypothetical protein